MYQSYGVIWRVPFAVANPDVVIERRDGKECRPYRPINLYMGQICYGTADLNLRDAELKQMHLYLAFKEKMLYATAADAPPPKSP